MGSERCTQLWPGAPEASGGRQDWGPGGRLPQPLWPPGPIHPALQVLQALELLWPPVCMSTGSTSPSPGPVGCCSTARSCGGGTACSPPNPVAGLLGAIGQVVPRAPPRAAHVLRFCVAGLGDGGLKCTYRTLGLPAVLADEGRPISRSI